MSTNAINASSLEQMSTPSAGNNLPEGVINQFKDTINYLMKHNAIDKDNNKKVS